MVVCSLLLFNNFQDKKTHQVFWGEKQLIPKNYIKPKKNIIDILKECTDFRELYKEINELISVFSDSDGWEDYQTDIGEIFKKVITERTYVYESIETASADQRSALLTHYNIMLCQLYQLSGYLQLEPSLRTQLLEVIESAIGEECFSNISAVTPAQKYQLELLNDILSNSQVILAATQGQINGIITQISSINPKNQENNSNSSSGESVDSLCGQIIYNILNELEVNCQLSLCRHAFEAVLFMFTQHSRNSKAKTIARLVAQNSSLAKVLLGFAQNILLKGHTFVEDAFPLEFTLQVAKRDYSIVQPVIIFLNTILTAKKNLPQHAIHDIKSLYLFFARLAQIADVGNLNSSNNSNSISSINNNNNSNIVDPFMHVLNALQMKNMNADQKEQLVKYTIKYIKKNQNYSLLKKAPLSMPPEKFKIANAVVKAESTLLSLLENTSVLSYEEKTKVVDRIHDQAIEKSEAFSEFFYEEFLHLFKSEDPADAQIQAYSKRCLSDIYYSVVSRLFCEDEVLDLRLLGDRLGGLRQKDADRALELHGLIQKSLFKETLILSKERVFSLLDVFSRIMYPSGQTKFDPLRGLVGFIINSYESFYDEDYFEIQVGNNSGVTAGSAGTLRLSDSFSLTEFIFKRLGGQWGSELDEWGKKRSYICYQGITKVIRNMLKSRNILERILDSGEITQKTKSYLNKRIKGGQSNEQILDDIVMNRQEIKNAISTEKSNLSLLSWETTQERIKICQRIVSACKQSSSNGSSHKIEILSEASTACFLSSKLITELFNFFTQLYNEGNIAAAESIIHFLWIIRKAECSIITQYNSKQQIPADSTTISSSKSSLFDGLGILDFFADKYEEFKKLTSIYPGKINLKLHQLKLINNFIDLVSSLNSYEFFFSGNRDPEDLSNSLITDLKTFSTGQILKVIKIIYDLDHITSAKRFESLLNQGIKNLLLRPLERITNTALIYIFLKHSNIKTLTEQQEQTIITVDLLNSLLSTLKTHLSEYTAWNSPDLISSYAYTTRLLLKTTYIVIYSLKLPQTQTQDFLEILQATMLNPKSFSLTIKNADETYLKIIAFEVALKILLRVDLLLSGEQEMQLSLSVIILGTASSNPSIRQAVFRKIPKNANDLPRIFLVALQLFLLDHNDNIRILCNALVRAISEKHQRYFFNESKGQENIIKIQIQEINNQGQQEDDLKETKTGIDFSQSLQYQVVYLFGIYMNHPHYLLNNSAAHWKHFEMHFWESLDILLISKQQFPECFSLLASIVVRLKNNSQYLSHIIPSSMFTQQSAQQFVSLKSSYAQTAGKITNESLKSRISKIVSVSQSNGVLQQTFQLMCDIALELIIQKWIGFKSEQTLKTFKIDIPLPISLYKIIDNKEEIITAPVPVNMSNAQQFTQRELPPKKKAFFDSKNTNSSNENSKNILFEQSEEGSQIQQVFKQQKDSQQQLKSIQSDKNGKKKKLIKKE